MPRTNSSSASTSASTSTSEAETTKDQGSVEEAKVSEAPKGFDASGLADDKFYAVRLSRSTVLFGDPLPAAASPRLSGAAVKQIADAVSSVEEVAEDAPLDLMRREGSGGPIATN